MEECIASILRNKLLPDRSEDMIKMRFIIFTLRNLGVSLLKLFDVIL